MTTLGVDFKVKDMLIGQKHVKVQIWDTAGQERFRNITNGYYRGAHGVAIVFDVTNSVSFSTTTAWIREISKRASPNSLKVLIANKTDMTNLRVVSEEQGRSLSQDHSMYYFETSAKDDLGVSEAFDFMANKILSSIEVSPDYLNITPENLLKKVNDNPREQFREQSTICTCCKV